MGARATGRSSWLVAPGLLVAFLRAALGWPAPVFALLLAREAVASQLSRGGIVLPGAIVSAAVQALTTPRALSILLGLWLAGLLAAAALRVAWVAGALPTLGRDLARGASPDPAFADGVAFRFAPLLRTALLGFAVELAAQLYAWCIYLSAAVLAWRGGGTHPLGAALLGALALTSAVAAPIAAALVADAALARTALSGDLPARALAEGGRRVLARPGAFLLSAFVLAVASAAIVGSADAMKTAALGVASGAPALLAVGPRLVATVISAGVAALLDLWRLGTVAALACGEEA